MFGLLTGKIGAVIAALVAIGLVVSGIYRAGLHAGRAELDAAVTAERNAGLEQQRQVALASADAYSRELEAAGARTVAAIAAEREAGHRVSVASKEIQTRVKVIRDASNHVPAAVCFPDDLRMHIDEVGTAIGDSFTTDQGADGHAAGAMSAAVRSTSAGPARAKTKS